MNTPMVQAYNPRKKYARKQVSRNGKPVDAIRFAQEYVANGGNATQAILATRKYVKKSSASQQASAMMKRPEVKEEIRLALDKYNLTYERILDVRAKMLIHAEDAIKDMKFTPENLDKNLVNIMVINEKLEEKKINNNLHAHIHLNPNATHKEIIDKRNKLASFFDQVIDGDVVEEPEQDDDSIVSE